METILLIALACLAAYILYRIIQRLRVRVKPEIDPKSIGVVRNELIIWRHEHFLGKRDGIFDGEYLDRDSQYDLSVRLFNRGSADMCLRIAEALEREIAKQEKEDEEVAKSLREVLRTINRISMLQMRTYK